MKSFPSGVKDTVFENWNHRFGIYKNTDGSATSRPDFTGYSYTPTNWNVNTGKAYLDFIAKRQEFASCKSGNSDCNTQNNDVVVNATQLKKNGADRRLVLVAVVSDLPDSHPPGTVVGFACMLMLQPIPQPVKEDIYLEYRGNANNPASPCKGSGIVGGTTGPVVPVLVR